MDSKNTDVADTRRLGVMKPCVRWPPAKMDIDANILRASHVTDAGLLMNQVTGAQDKATPKAHQHVHSPQPVDVSFRQHWAEPGNAAQDADAARGRVLRTVGQIQAHETVVRLQESGVDGEVGRRAGVRLHVDAPLRRVQVESLQRPLLRDNTSVKITGGFRNVCSKTMHESRGSAVAEQSALPIYPDLWPAAAKRKQCRNRHGRRTWQRRSAWSMNWLPP